MIELDYYKGDNTPLYDWIEEEWDALKDGQYGDYPGGDIDYDVFGFGGWLFPQLVWRTLIKEYLMRLFWYEQIIQPQHEEVFDNSVGYGH